MSFPTLEAQPRVASYLEAASRSGRLPHALLFLGPEGSLQMEAVREIAKSLFCRDRKGAAGCGDCVSCRQVEGGHHPDLRIFAADEDSRTIKVDRVREMISEAYLKPFQAPSKVFVIEGADEMNETAQNALLKTLEEPPANTYLILNCHAAEKLIPTVRSRTHTIHFRPIGSAAEVKPESRKLSSQMVARALRGLEVPTPEAGLIKRDELCTVLDQAISDVRDALMIRLGCESLIEETPDILEKRRYAERHDASNLIRVMETFAATKEQVEQSANIRLALADLWERL